jgi:hypothetical protein
VQATPDQVKILAGQEYLRCLRLTERGLTRWFTACCMTPLANTPRHAWMPFVGVMNCVLDTEEQALLGPTTHLNGPHTISWTIILRSAWVLLQGMLLRRHHPNAFFNDRGKPIAQPEVIG